MKYMLDTNICIYIIKMHPESVIKKFQSLAPTDVCISSVTLSELEYGVNKSQHLQKNHHALQEFILPLDIALFDESAAKHYGSIRAHLEKKGALIGPLDLMIAAHARSKNMKLVTHNIKEFARVPDLKMETWVKQSSANK